MSLKIACATSDGVHFHDGHFGDAEKYIIYDITSERYTKIDEIPNLSPEEKMHADPRKAKSITAMMKTYGVEVLVNKRFGPNITRIRKKFVPVIVSDDKIDTALKKILQRYKEIKQAFDSVHNKSDEYEIIYIRD